MLPALEGSIPSLQHVPIGWDLMRVGVEIVFVILNSHLMYGTDDGLDVAYIAPWNVGLPGLTIFLMVLAINVVGDGLRSALRKRLTH